MTKISPQFNNQEYDDTQFEVDQNLLPANTSFSQKLYGLPLSRKTSLIPWFSFGALVLILGTGGLILHQSLKSQLLKQAEFQLAVTNIKYNIKIDQMGFGFRGQSDNLAIIAAADTVAQGQAIPGNLRQEVSSILQNEIKARNIEYATLVGKDKKIIVNANANRSGQIFDPDGLVSQVLASPKQIKTSQIVSWKELQAEKPPLPKGLKAESALIRYTVTPVFAADQKQVTGVLVSGDIVNGKLSIVEEAVKAFTDERGYSAVYFRQPSGEFTLSTSFADFGKQEEPLALLSDNKILDLALKNSGETINQLGKIEGKTYALGAKAIPNSRGEGVAVLVYGNPVSSISSVIRSSLLAQLVLSAAIFVIILALSNILEKAIAEPIQKLQQITQEFSQGNMKARATIHSTDEVGLLASSFNTLADSIEINEARLREDAKRSRLLKEVALNIAQAVDIPEVLKVAVEISRTALAADRVMYYRFDENWQGKVIAESVAAGLPMALGAEINDPCFAEEYAEKYQQGRVKAVANIYEAGLNSCHLKMLEPFAVVASLVTAVVVEERLVGLLIAHQCNQSRAWQENEIELLSQIAVQTGSALERVKLLEKQKLAEQQERTAKENLQRRALELLMEVDPVSRGDLTVQVRVQEDEIGTIGDSYNATIESLRKLVDQVQTAATLVSTTTSDQDASIQDLSTDASAQTQEITAVLARIRGITNSIQAVANNAEAAEAAVLKAAATVKAGDEAMNQTVVGFQGIRETVAETAKKVKRLGESSQKISKVVNVISNFADQTNLLALNASIEAAHAGEEGRGFAVVADEVRSLARQSAEATAEIEALVAEIQSETNEVVAAMESGTEQVVAGTKLVDATRNSLIQIADASQEINQLVGAIAAATVEQSKDSAVVSQTMIQVAAISDKTASSAGEVSASFKELLIVAEQLQNSVSKFKVR